MESVNKSKASNKTVAPKGVPAPFAPPANVEKAPAKVAEPTTIPCPGLNWVCDNGKYKLGTIGGKHFACDGTGKFPTTRPNGSPRSYVVTAKEQRDPMFPHWMEWAKGAGIAVTLSKARYFGRRAA